MSTSPSSGLPPTPQASMAPITRTSRPKVVGSPDGPVAPFPMRLHGIVEKGFGRGSKELGIPTANLPRTSIGPLTELNMTGIYFGFAQLHPTTSSSSSSSSSALDATPSAPKGTLSKEDIENLPDHTAAYPQAQKEAEHIDTNSEQAPSSSTNSTESSTGDKREVTEPKLQKEDYDVWPMVMSVGYNPYYKNKELTAEVHIMHNYPTSFYSHPLTVSILGYIRPELDYVSKDALVEDINEDVRVALRSLGRDNWVGYGRDLGGKKENVKSGEDEVVSGVEGLALDFKSEGEKKDDRSLKIKLEFGGGLHLLFSSQPKHSITLPESVPEDGRPTDVRYLIKWMKDTILSERVEMFGDGEGVRPGILVLINDTDWELEGELDYRLEEGDEIVFISTLHGG